MNKKNAVSSSIVGLLSSVLAFLGIISCCGFPLIAAFLAWFGIGASQLSFFSKYHTLFIVAAIMALLYGFYIVYFKKAKESDSSCCNIEIQGENEPSTCCPPTSKKSGKLAKIMLWIGAAAVMSTFLMDNGTTSGSSESDNLSPNEIQEAPTLLNEDSSCCPSKKSKEEVKPEKPQEKTSCCPKEDL